MFPMKSKGGGRARVHFEEGLFAGYGSPADEQWPSPQHLLLRVSVSMTLERIHIAAGDALELEDEDGEMIPENVAAPFRATLTPPSIVKHLIESYEPN